ncbi:hypothetical protein [Paludibacter sp.]|uniref:DUF6874 family protein n=1 Tax=Paludibacter sp. TaxID=1898105 RepID=UPI001353A984|nr:hypothetical protein [Paludibacter sp.]MTK53326.1 hypothetical protein [Paludibacter sp.]
MEPNTINWDISDEEIPLIVKIALRAKEELKCNDVVNTQMNITATHLNGCTLDLIKLLEFDESNFAHDIFGIEKHINKVTGQLTKGFLPRSTKHI